MGVICGRGLLKWIIWEKLLKIFFCKGPDGQTWDNFVPLLWKQKMDAKERKDAPFLNPVLRVVKVHDKAILPSKATAGAAAYDLYAVENQVIEPYTSTKIPLGICVAIPLGMYGRIAGRSGLALNQGVFIGGGVIDSDYRQECGVIAVVISTESFKIKVGDRIAQLIMEQIGNVEVVECTDLEATERKGGFGSTGI